MTTEEIVYGWIKALVEAAAGDDPLSGAQVSKTAFGGVTSNRCIQIGPVLRATPRPSAGGDEVEEFDAEIVIILLSQVADTKTDDDYASARGDAIQMALSLARAAFDDNTLGGAARDSMPDDLPRDFTTVAKTAPYAVANLKLKLNPSGA